MRLLTTVAVPQCDPTGCVNLPTQWVWWGCRENIQNVNDWSIYFLIISSILFVHIPIKLVGFFKSRAKFSIWAYSNHKSADVRGKGAPPESACVLGTGIYVGMTEWVYTWSGAATLQTSTAVPFVVLALLLCFHFKKTQKSNRKEYENTFSDFNTVIRNFNGNGCQQSKFAI